MTEKNKEISDFVFFGHSLVCLLPLVKAFAHKQSMSGKDFYEDDSGDASKYYRPDAPATASFFAAPAAAGGGEGAAGVPQGFSLLFLLHVIN